LNRLSPPPVLEMHIHIRYFVALIFSGVLLLLTIIGAAVPWYNDGPADLYLTYWSAGGYGTCNYSNSDCLPSDMRSMFGIILACCIVAIILNFVDLVFLVLFSFGWFGDRLRWRHHLRIPLIIISGIVTLLCLAAWCFLFWLPSAACSSCDWKFSGNGYGPDAGFGIYIVCTVFALIVFLLALLGGSPSEGGYKILE